MGVRITCPKELMRLAQKGLLPATVAQESIKVLSKGNNKKTARAGNVLDICPLIPENPADILYQALVRKYGRFYEGGLVVYELEFSFDNRRWRMDIAIPSKRVALELDGWVDHGKRLSGFKRDREKSLCFEQRGWRVIHFSSAQIKHELQETLNAIGKILSFCPDVDHSAFHVQPTGFDRSKFIMK